MGAHGCMAPCPECKKGCIICNPCDPKSHTKTTVNCWPMSEMSSLPIKKPHEHQFTIPVEWEYQRKQSETDAFGDLVSHTIDDKNGDWRFINSQQATRKTVTKLRCSCGEEIER